jgi:small subunit ribosomal protein S9
MDKTQKYFEALGRRKTSVARVRLYLGEKYFLVNQKPLENYFPTLELQKIAKEALERVKSLDKFGVSALINGGGIHSQAEALRHAIARALVNFNPDFKKDLKEAGFLKRDPRMRERKKFGLKRARRAPQWQKR